MFVGERVSLHCAHEVEGVALFEDCYWSHVATLGGLVETINGEFYAPERPIHHAHCGPIGVDALRVYCA
jgi:hypothetical protein